jgi:hypothetical protein
MENPTREQVKAITDARWSVEVYHREIKQTCGIAAWFEQHKCRIQHQTTLYQQNWNVIKGAIQDQIKILMLQAS